MNYEAELNTQLTNISRQYLIPILALAVLFCIPSASFAQTDEDGQVPAVRSDRPQSMAWVTDELIAETCRVWSNMYGRTVSIEEAFEILNNVKRLAEVLPQEAIDWICNDPGS